MDNIKATQELIALDLKPLSELPSDAGVASLQRILTIWSLTQSDYDYRQGMHEVASFLWTLRARESLPTPVDPQKETLDIHSLLAPEEVEADTFFLFSGIMQRLASQYFIERAGSPSLIKAILYRVDRILESHLFGLELEWSPILLYAFMADLAVVGIVSCISTRYVRSTYSVSCGNKYPPLGCHDTTRPFPIAAALCIYSLDSDAP